MTGRCQTTVLLCRVAALFLLLQSVTLVPRDLLGATARDLAPLLVVVAAAVGLWCQAPRLAPASAPEVPSIGYWANLLVSLLGFWFATFGFATLVGHVILLRHWPSYALTRDQLIVLQMFPAGIQLLLGLAILGKAPVLARWICRRAQPGGP